MRHGIWMVGVAILAGACAPPTPESRLIDEAAEAMGGSGRVRAVRTLVLEGEGQQPNIGQNMSPDAELTVWKVTQYNGSSTWRTRACASRPRASRALSS